MKKILLVLIIVLLFWRCQYSLNRYFDIDEFAHLHWGYSFFIGEQPYKDFFYLFPPFFLFTLWPLFYFFGRQVLTVVAARIFIFVVFLLLILVLYLFSKKLRDKETALFSVFILTFLPLPLDKMLEIRPDMPALVFALLGLYLFVLGEEKNRRLTFFLSGILLGVSLGFVPKTIFFLTAPLLMIIYQYFRAVLRGRMASFFRRYLPFGIGLMIPMIVITVMAISIGKAGFAFYSMTRMAADVTKVLASKFYINASFFFYPNDVFYGKGNKSAYYLSNLIIYLAAIIMMIGRLVASFSYKSYRRCVVEFVFSLTLFINLVAYIKFFPLKHAQYLIPLTPFIAFYSADFWFSLMRLIGKKLKIIFRFLETGFPKIFTIALSVYFIILFKETYDIRIWWNNRSSMDKINYFLSSYPPNQAIFDLTGESIFFPNGYYFCCIPYGQYSEAFDFPLPDIKNDMEKRKTDIVHLGTTDRIGVLPKKQADYIRENFEASTRPEILVRKSQL